MVKEKQGVNCSLIGSSYDDAASGSMKVGRLLVS
jgi:hypothetical protein